MQADNPFAAPQSLVADPSGSAGAVSPGVVETLRRTKGWVRFMAVLGFIGAGLSLLMGLVFGVLGFAGSEAFARASTPMPFPPTAIFFGYALLLSLAAVIYLFPSLRLLRYASAITRLELARDSGALEGALEQQRAFWRLVGVISLASILLYGLLIVGGMGAAMVAAMRAAS
ncbi:MAG TPA: hypothetical protein VFO11_06775 [Candidatus Polarisedimenticolaceae bacterium]|nr:hypothetical protein [Candidatus Polarisedimenticolaceae bacterium]